MIALYFGGIGSNIDEYFKVMFGSKVLSKNLDLGGSFSLQLSCIVQTMRCSFIVYKVQGKIHPRDNLALFSILDPKLPRPPFHLNKTLL